MAAGGMGTRLGGSGPKALVDLGGRPMLCWAIEDLQASPRVTAIVVVAPAGFVDRFEAVVAGAGLDKVIATVPGGASRQASVAAGLGAVPGDPRFVAVHDAARPFAGPDLIGELLERLEADRDAAGAVPVLPLADTVRSVDEAGQSLGVVDRAGLRTVQTPQLFRGEALRLAYARAAADGVEGTDDAALVERLGMRVHLVPGPANNIKVTTAVDLTLAAGILAGPAGRPPAAEPP